MIIITTLVDATLQNFIDRHTIDFKNVQRDNKKKGENLQDIKLTQTRCQNLSMSKIDHLD
jgi:hypothetical protein